MIGHCLTKMPTRMVEITLLACAHAKWQEEINEEAHRFRHNRQSKVRCVTVPVFRVRMNNGSKRISKSPSSLVLVINRDD